MLIRVLCFGLNLFLCVINNEFTTISTLTPATGMKPFTVSLCGVIIILSSAYWFRPKLYSQYLNKNKLQLYKRKLSYD